MPSSPPLLCSPLFSLAAAARLTVLCASKCSVHHLSSLWLTFPSPLQPWSIPGSCGRISFRCTSDLCGDVFLSWVVLLSSSCLHPWPGRSKDQYRTPVAPSTHLCCLLPCHVIIGDDLWSHLSLLNVYSLYIPQYNYYSPSNPVPNISYTHTCSCHG